MGFFTGFWQEALQDADSDGSNAQVVQFACCEEEPQAETPRAQAPADEDDDFFDAVEDSLPTETPEARHATCCVLSPVWPRGKSMFSWQKNCISCHWNCHFAIQSMRSLQSHILWTVRQILHYFFSELNFIMLFFDVASDCILLRWLVWCDLKIFGPCLDAPIHGKCHKMRWGNRGTQKWKRSIKCGMDVMVKNFAKHLVSWLESSSGERGEREREHVSLYLCAVIYAMCLHPQSHTHSLLACASRTHTRQEYMWYMLAISGFCMFLFRPDFQELPGGRRRCAGRNAWSGCVAGMHCFEGWRMVIYEWWS